MKLNPLTGQWEPVDEQAYKEGIQRGFGVNTPPPAEAAQTSENPEYDQIAQARANLLRAQLANSANNGIENVGYSMDEDNTVKPFQKLSNYISKRKKD